MRVSWSASVNSRRSFDKFVLAPNAHPEDHRHGRILYSLELPLCSSKVDPDKQQEVERGRLPIEVSETERACLKPAYDQIEDSRVVVLATKFYFVRVVLYQALEVRRVVTQEAFRTNKRVSKGFLELNGDPITTYKSGKRCCLREVISRGLDLLRQAFGPGTIDIGARWRRNVGPMPSDSELHVRIRRLKCT
jgi:hypothetical protein